MTTRYLPLALATALLVAAAIGSAGSAEAGGGCRGMPATTGEGTDIYMTGACFHPTVLYAEPGDTVSWLNGESLAHTVTGANTVWGDYSELGIGDSVAQRFDEAGTYPYFCLLHPGMIGAVVVGDAPAPPDGLVLATPAFVPGLEASRSAATIASPDDGGSERWVLGVFALTAVAAGLAGAGGFALGWRRR